jgi:hypothetical protein
MKDMDRRITEFLASPERQARTASDVGRAVALLDQITTEALENMMIAAWTVARLAHKFGASKAKFLELVDAAYEYSVEFDKKNGDRGWIS